MKVLFIGNSHTYFNDMPHLFSDMCRKAGEAETDVTMITYSGRTLAWHEKEYFSVRFNLLYGNYDYCMSFNRLQDPFSAGGRDDTRAERLIKLCKSVERRRCCIVTWAEKEKPENQ